LPSFLMYEMIKAKVNVTEKKDKARELNNISVKFDKPFISIE